VWIAGGGDSLRLVRDGRQTVTIDAPAEGRWTQSGSPTIPSNSPDFRTLTRDGTRLLVALTEPDDDGNEVAARVVLVDLVRQQAEVLCHCAGAGSAFWAQDDRHVVIIGRSAERQQVAHVVDTVDGSQTTIDAIPRGYYVIAAR
jgi:hypothetical protein